MMLALMASATAEGPCQGACSSGTAYLQLQGNVQRTSLYQDDFEAMDGGVGRACRGATTTDNSPSNYVVMHVSNLEECKSECINDSRCRGIEYSNGRCEVWIREAGIMASIPLNGFSCYRYGLYETTLPPREGTFEAVEGGEGRACRGASGGDNLPSYYTLAAGVGSLDECKGACLQNLACKGIEFSDGRCEVWTRPEGIEASIALSGFSCYRFVDPSISTTTPFPDGSFEAVDGGKGRACRGANSADNKASYYSVMSASSLSACKALCYSDMTCKGLEFSGHRCEIWSHEIQASVSLDNFECWRKTNGEGPLSCQALTAELGATDAVCTETCSYLEPGQWPCGQGGPCVCSGSTATATTTSGTTATATTVPSTTATTTVMTTGTTTTSQSTTTTTTTTTSTTTSTTLASTTPPVSTSTLSSPSTLIDTTVQALQSSNSDGVFLYDTGTEWLPSDIYTWPDMIEAVKLMASTGVGQLKLWLGDTDHVYGLVNVAAFLAQCMQETIQYNACDENNWSDNNVVQEAGGSTYSSTSACGQLHQSYQDYSCSAEEDALAGGRMACEVDPSMEMRAFTQAKWYGAPAKLFCAPKSKVPKAPRWDYSSPWCPQEGGWGYEAPFADDVDLDTYFEYVNSGGGCKDYQGIKTGGWKFTGSGCVDGACPGSDAPLFGQPEGRTDLEGCCWWGRGVIQTTGTCNFGKLNFFMGKRAADEGRTAVYPSIDFCKNPNSICDPSSPPELKWVAGMFYWLNAVQPYNSGGWNYITELKKWVDNGMKTTDKSFINGASGIVNRGCHNPPNCNTGELHAGTERAANFEKVLKAMGLI